jgi:hypothetical protein
MSWNYSNSDYVEDLEYSSSTASFHDHLETAAGPGSVNPSDETKQRARTAKKYLWLPLKPLPPSMVPRDIPSVLSPPPMDPSTSSPRLEDEFPPRLGLFAAHNKAWAGMFASMMWGPHDWVYITYSSSVWPHHPGELARILRSIGLVQTIVVDAAAVAETAHAVQLRRIIDRNPQLSRVVAVDMPVSGQVVHPSRRMGVSYHPAGQRVAGLARTAHRNENKIEFSQNGDDDFMAAVAWGSACRRGIPDDALRKANRLVPITNLALSESETGRLAVWEFVHALRHVAMSGTDRDWPDHVELTVARASLTPAPAEDHRPRRSDDWRRLQLRGRPYWGYDDLCERLAAIEAHQDPDAPASPVYDFSPASTWWSNSDGYDPDWMADIEQFPSASGMVTEEDFNAGVGDS